MTVIRDLLEAAVPPAPPSAVDIDRLIHGSRRSARLRTTALVVGTAAVVTGTVTLSIAIRPGASGPAWPGSSPTSAVRVVGSDGVPQGLEAALRAAVQAAVPGATITRVHATDDYMSCLSTQNSPGGTTPGQCGSTRNVIPFHGQLEYSVVVGDQRGLLVLYTAGADAPGTIQSCDFTGLASPDPDAVSQCHETTENGVRILDRSGNYHSRVADDPKERSLYFTIVKPGVSVLDIALCGVFLPPDYTQYQQPPMTVEQLKAIALAVADAN